MDWASLFEFDVSPLEIFVRGSTMYWLLFALFRFVLRRDVGSITVADVLVLVLIADAAQNAMAGGYSTIAEGALLVGTIAFWNYLLDWASFHSPLVRRFAQAPPLLLIRQGRILHRNLRSEMVSLDELRAKLRQHGIDDVAQVKSAYMESDGEITVIRAQDDGGADDAPQRSPGAP